ncbi:hypothetical protein GPECTOR_16g745 [Gonium pectorale]|uniref:Uncharacterized protein n=1 Tax=Gonium pectorale TaxID=33097 RepID=A0A150GMK7_GONPE|nr:hypothetical protein GPECTOR_16g745 [Gonium pectorale]|eukprot:KXZ50570.1 hypothetical protein GPECTOR_16g745 [Gonium pectorale]
MQVGSAHEGLDYWQQREQQQLGGQEAPVPMGVAGRGGGGSVAAGALSGGSTRCYASLPYEELKKHFTRWEGTAPTTNAAAADGRGGDRAGAAAGAGAAAAATGNPMDFLGPYDLGMSQLHFLDGSGGVKSLRAVPLPQELLRRWAPRLEGRSLVLVVRQGLSHCLKHHDLRACCECEDSHDDHCCRCGFPRRCTCKKGFQEPSTEQLLTAAGTAGRSVAGCCCCCCVKCKRPREGCRCPDPFRHQRHQIYRSFLAELDPAAPADQRKKAKGGPKNPEAWQTGAFPWRDGLLPGAGAAGSHVAVRWRSWWPAW